MRTIKFRAWNVATQSMYYSNKNYTVWCGGIECSVNSDNGKIPGNFIPMQYTGLKDKNGKEIYEGDILEYSAYLFGQKEIFRIIVSYYTTKSSFLVDGDARDYLWALLSNNQCEVIGNIHENKDLLK